VRFLSVEPLLEDLGEIDLSAIHWVIAGGESGPGARRMEREWAISIRNLCKRFAVPFFFKQWGGVRKHKTGRLLEGRTYDEYPAKSPFGIPNDYERTAAAKSIEALVASPSLVRLPLM
jgi:protein gp37